MDIKYPRRLLILGSREAGVLDVVKDLTGSSPAPDVNGSTAGLTHEWQVKTAYYKANVPIWIDEITDVEAWKAEFMRKEAKEVVEAVGAWIYCFTPSQDGNLSSGTEAAMKGIQEVIDTHSDGYAGELVMLAVAKGKESQKSRQEEQEDKCMDCGFEYIDYTASGSNEFGEKQGFLRLKEALEANEWTTSAGDENLDFDNLDFDAEDDIGDFSREEVEMTTELFGMKAALDGVDDDEEEMLQPERQAEQVDDLSLVMARLLAVKEQSVDLPEDQRKRMAAKAVRKLMNDNPDI